MNAIARTFAAALLTLPSAGTARFEAAASADPSMHVEGSGGVTVVLESGLGDTGDVWRSVQTAIADHCAGTVSYTRDGYGEVRRSASGRRDAERIVSELRTRLRASGYAPPYVLVGHSLGGLYMQYFARRYPGDVRGLVLVDSMHAHQLDRVKAATPGIYRMTNLLTMLRGGIMRREFLGIRSTTAELEALPKSARLPTIVLSSTRPGTGETSAFRALAARLQAELSASYAARRHEFVAGSGHYIHLEQPRVVIDAVRELSGCDASPTLADGIGGSHAPTS